MSGAGLTFGSLFAGIGGFDLGFERAGFRCLWQVEIDEYCRAVLAKHWPDVERFTDVRECGNHNLRPVDIIAGGFPCQPHSVAGKRRGEEDDRNLWPDYLRIVKALEPRYVVAENVPGIVTTYIDTVLSDLDDAGYTCWTFNIPAVAFDAPHRRERIFVIAHAESNLRRASGHDGPKPFDGSGASMAHTKEYGERSGLRQGREGTERGRRLGNGGSPFDVAHTSGERLAQRQGKSGNNGKEQPSTVGAGWWTVEPDVGRVVTRISPWVDGGGVNAYAKNESARKILRALRNPDESQEIQWTARGRRGIQAEEILLSALCEPTGETYPLGNISLESKETQEIIMRSLWINGSVTCPSCRRSTDQQRSGKHPDIMRLLSQLLTCNCGSVGLDNTGTATATENRVDRLRALGNAVVPQVAEWIAHRIAQAEQQT